MCYFKRFQARSNANQESRCPIAHPLEPRAVSWRLPDRRTWLLAVDSRAASADGAGLERRHPQRDSHLGLHTHTARAGMSAVDAVVLGPAAALLRLVATQESSHVCMHACVYGYALGNVSAITPQSRSDHAATTQQHAAITQQPRSNHAATRLGNNTAIT